jgi:hypothetical protein
MSPFLKLRFPFEKDNIFTKIAPGLPRAIDWLVEVFEKNPDITQINTKIEHSAFFNYFISVPKQNVSTSFKARYFGIIKVYCGVSPYFP